MELNDVLFQLEYEQIFEEEFETYSKNYNFFNNDLATLSTINSNIFNINSNNINNNNFNILTTKKKKKINKNLRFFICLFCLKIYKSKENVLIHYKNIHSCKKAYKCEYCNNSYCYRNGKIYHVRKNHTKIYPYKCPLYNLCKKEFVSKGALNYHIKNQHKNEQI